MAPILTLNPQRDILQPFYRKLLPLLKVNRNIPQALMHIPHYMGGFALQALETEQGIEAVSIIISSFTSKLPTLKQFK